jgi:hypothetical protein
MTQKIMCKKDYNFFKKGETYDYWTNFNGLNHFVSSGLNNQVAFEGMELADRWIIALTADLFANPVVDPQAPIHGISIGGFVRPYLYDYFYTLEEMRDLKINSIFT